jgi:hypothetical protein
VPQAPGFLQGSDLNYSASLLLRNAIINGIETQRAFSQELARTIGALDIIDEKSIALSGIDALP